MVEFGREGSLEACERPQLFGRGGTSEVGDRPQPFHVGDCCGLRCGHDADMIEGLGGLVCEQPMRTEIVKLTCSTFMNHVDELSPACEWKGFAPVVMPLLSQVDSVGFDHVFLKAKWRFLSFSGDGSNNEPLGSIPQTPTAACSVDEASPVEP